MRRCGPYLSLGVPGLAEGRPSLLVGDRVIVCEPGKLMAGMCYHSFHCLVEFPISLAKELVYVILKVVMRDRNIMKDLSMR